MKCAVHPEVDATGFCRNCGKPLCPHARATCAARSIASLAWPIWSLCRQRRAAARTRAPNPGAALALGFIPGLGAVYNGEYVKALIHVFVFAGLIAAQTNDISAGYHAFLGIALGAFCLTCRSRLIMWRKRTNGSGSAARLCSPADPGGDHEPSAPLS